MLIKTAHEDSGAAKDPKNRFPLRLPLFVGLLASIGFLNQKAQCQDITAPRFFEFNVRPTTASNSPVLPQTLSVVAPQTKPEYHIDAALKFPIKLNGKTRIIGEVKHKNEFINGFYSIDDDQFKQLELKQSKVSIILWRDLNDRVRFTNILSVSSNSTDIFSMDNRAWQFRNIGLFEKKLANGSTIGVGASVSYKQKLTAMPVFKYETTFANDWALEVLLPKKIEVSKDLTKKSRLLFTVKGSNANYSLGNRQVVNDYMASSSYKRMDIRGLVGYQRQITPLIGFSVEVGASMPLKSGIYATDKSQSELYNFKSGVSPYFNVGFFLSLPR